MTVSLFVQHRVKDFAVWKAFYDENAGPVLQQAGVLVDSVHQSLDDPNTVIVYHQFGNAEQLHTFMAMLNSEESHKMAATTGTLMDTMIVWTGEDV